MQRGALIVLGVLACSASASADTEIHGWTHWKRASKPDPDTALPQKVQTGNVRKGRMTGHWTAQDKWYRGAGDLIAGNGAWESLYVDGGVLARGNIKNDLPDGPWTIFHRSGQNRCDRKIQTRQT